MSEGAFASAAAAFGTTRRILKVRPEWLHLVAAGAKTLEIRGARCPHEEWVSLASTGQQEVICRVKLGPGHPLTDSHRRNNADAVEATGYATPWAWPIEALELLPAPMKIPPSVARGPCSGSLVNGGRPSISRRQPQDPSLFSISPLPSCCKQAMINRL